jgi:hypothetical protein
MSAAQQHVFSYSARQLSEWEATQSVSRQVSGATEPQSGVRAIAEAVLLTSGVIRLTFESAAELASMSIPLEWGADASPGPQGCALAPIASAGRNWGEIRLYFDLRSKALESPLAFARFVGQQIARLLNQFDLIDQRQSLARQLDTLRVRLATRKLAQRAAGIVAQRRGIAVADALGFLTRYSREYRRRLYHVAEAVVLSHEDTWNRRPVLRRLQPGEVTFEPRNPDRRSQQ